MIFQIEKVVNAARLIYFESKIDHGFRLTKWINPFLVIIEQKMIEFQNQLSIKLSYNKQLCLFFAHKCLYLHQAIWAQKLQRKKKNSMIVVLFFISNALFYCYSPPEKLKLIHLASYFTYYHFITLNKSRLIISGNWGSNFCKQKVLIFGKNASTSVLQQLLGQLILSNRMEPCGEKIKGLENSYLYQASPISNKYLKMFFYGMPCNYFEHEYTLQPYAFFIIPEEELEQKKSSSPTNQDSDQEPQQKQISIQTMTKQLEKRHKRAKSRFWSEEEDEMLMGLAKAKIDWEKIAMHFKGKDMNICRRRYERLVKQNEKWPKESQELIKRLFQEEKLSWLQIQEFLPMYTKKQIKERYKNFLQVKIRRAQWTIQEDLKLWQEVKKHGNKWVNFTKLFEGRSQLQLKNRYNKLIRPLEESLLNIEHSHKEEECSDESWHLDD